MGLVFFVQIQYEVCSQNSTSKESFSLIPDICNFSNKMTDSDTIKVNLDLDICDGQRSEKHLLTKRNDSVFIEMTAIDAGQKDIYPQRFYCNFDHDSLTYERLYCKRLHNDTIKRHDPRYVFIEIIHQTDTLTFWSKGLMDKIITSRYLWEIGRQFYSDFEHFQPIEIPKRPKNWQENPLDSINRSINKQSIEKILESPYNE
jgi:hypothetical protein